MWRKSRVEWFQAVQDRLSSVVQDRADLVTSLEMSAANNAEIQAAARAYLRACLEEPDGLNDDASLLDRLEEKIATLANRTPNGVLMPKAELDREYTALHAAISTFVHSLGLDDLIEFASCPIIMRTVAGTPDTGASKRPYSSSKVHADLWTGDPGDEILCFIPVLGDLENTTIDFFHSPDDFETRLMRYFPSYEDAEAQLEGFPLVNYPIKLAFGRFYMADAIVLHQTVRKGGRARVTLDFRLRRKTSPVEREFILSLCEHDRLDHYIPYQEWSSYGATAGLHFRDTFADAKAGIFTERPHNQRPYEVVTL